MDVIVPPVASAYFGRPTPSVETNSFFSFLGTASDVAIVANAAILLAMRMNCFVSVVS
jgi:hypothetical protein